MTDDILAAISECQPADVPRILAQLDRRVGRDILRENYFDLEAQGRQTGERPRFLQVGKFLTKVGDPPPMLVDRLLPEKSLILLCGKPKLGKSFLGLDIGDAISLGRSVCGEFSLSRTGHVSYLGMEDGMYEVANRLLSRGIRKEDEARPFHICTERVVLSTIEGINTFRDMNEEIEEEYGASPVLHIVDTAREGLGIKDWNDAAEVSEKVRFLREYARERGTVLLVAHNRKQIGGDPGDEIAGSGAFASSVDGWISVQRIEKRENGNRRMWLSIVGRGNMNGDAVVEMDTNTLHFHFIPEEDLEREAMEGREDSRQQRFVPILQALQNLGDKATVRQLARSMSMEYDTCRHAVNDAIDAGFIEETGETAAPESGRGRPAPTYRTRPNKLSNYRITPIGKEKQFDNSAAAHSAAVAAPPTAAQEAPRPQEEEGLEI